MLKKAGIVTVGITAGLLAVSPLAFAGDGGYDGGHGHGHHGHHGHQINNIDNGRGDNSQLGLVNTGDVSVLDNANVLSCSLNDADIPVSVLGILGGNATAGADAPTASDCSPGSTSQTNLDG